MEDAQLETGRRIAGLKPCEYLFVANEKVWWMEGRVKELSLTGAGTNGIVWG